MPAKRKIFQPNILLKHKMFIRRISGFLHGAIDGAVSYWLMLLSR